MVGIKDVQDKLTALVKKYRYVILVLCIGLGLMAIPSRSSGNETTAVTVVAEQEQAPDTEERLAQILSQIDGAGEVRVLLSIAAGEETLFQQDEDISEDGDGASTQSNTVTVTDADRGESGLIRQKNPPIYQGAIVVCQGAEDPQIRLAIVEAVCDITGLGADRISVLKMK